MSEPSAFLQALEAEIKRFEDNLLTEQLEGWFGKPVDASAGTVTLDGLETFLRQIEERPIVVAPPARSGKLNVSRLACRFAIPSRAFLARMAIP